MIQNSNKIFPIWERFYFISEVGDQIMVNFQHGHPDRPFVMDGMFHGGTGLGGGVNNHMKSMQTRCGIKILMNNAEKSVHILDPSGSNYLSDGKGNIVITAPNNITFNAGGNLTMNVGQNMTTTVEMNSEETIKMNKSLSVGVMNVLIVGKDFVTNVVGQWIERIKGNKESRIEKNKETVINGKGTTQITDTHEFHSQKEIQHNSGEKSKNH